MGSWAPWVSGPHEQSTTSVLRPGRPGPLENSGFRVFGPRGLYRVRVGRWAPWVGGATEHHGPRACESESRGALELRSLGTS
eukprot:4104132-Pyramimonas_sp.AAC.1